MWKIHLIILVLVSFCDRPVYTFQDGTQSASETEGRAKSLLSLLSGNGLYNPMVPMGFVFEGKKEQYTGNGADTPKFDPDNFAYKYAGASFGLAVNPFVPGLFNSESINNSPNYVHVPHPTKPPTGENNVTDGAGENIETKKDGDIFAELPVQTGSSPSGEVSNFAFQTFPENIMSALSINASNMFPYAKFSGQPGMLGIGSQLPLQAVIPEKGPVSEQQYLPTMLRNVSETRILSPVYNRYPGIEEHELQTSFGTDHIDISTPTPLFNGYPGMLGVGHMYSIIDSNLSESIDTTERNNSQRYSNSDKTGYQNNAVNIINENYISAIPGANTNNWKGEWPGKTSAGGDWSGDWSQKWPKSNTHAKEGKDGTSASQFGNSPSQSSSNTDWDGSWPGYAAKDESTRKSSNTSDLAETMAVLGKLINMLGNITGSVDISNNKATPKTFSQMVSSWKEEMKP